MGVSGESEGCAAARTWRQACAVLCPPAPAAPAAPGAPAAPPAPPAPGATAAPPTTDAAWQKVVDASPPDSVWHSISNCVAYQAGVWHNLLSKGMRDVEQPAAFKLALVLRHTPSELTVRLLADLLKSHPESQEVTGYVLSLLTDDAARRGCGGQCALHAQEVALRDLQLFGDCELAVLAASREEYDAHAKLVRAEYSKLTHHNYVELRIKVLNQFSQIPKLFHTEEFECFEAAARENIEREICTLREHLLTGRAD